MTSSSNNKVLSTRPSDIQFIIKNTILMNEKVPYSKYSSNLITSCYYNY